MNADERLAEMRHMERQLVRIDDTALMVVDDESLANGLRRQREAHERHAIEIEDLVRSREEAWPSTSADFRRHADEHLTNITRAQDTIDAARRVLMAEHDLAERYEAAQRSGEPEAAVGLIGRHLDDERRHIDELEHYVARVSVSGQGHGGGAYNDTGDEVGTGPGVGGRGSRRHGEREQHEP